MCVDDSNSDAGPSVHDEVGGGELWAWREVVAQHRSYQPMCVSRPPRPSPLRASKPSRTFLFIKFKAPPSICMHSAEARLHSSVRIEACVHTRCACG